jgi:hypothetical protein
MEDEKLSEREAFHKIQKISMDKNRKTKEVAEAMILVYEKLVNDHSRGHTSRNLLPSDATDIVRVTLIVAKHIGTVEHHDPRVFRMVFEGRGRPIGQVIPKGNLLRITG